MVLKEMSPNSSMKNKVLKEKSPNNSNMVLKEMSPNSGMKNKVLKEMSPNSSMKNKVLKEMSPNSSMKNKVLKEMSPNSSMKNKVLKEKSPNNSNMVLKEMSPNSSMKNKVLKEMSPNSSMKNKVLKEMSPNNSNMVLKEMSTNSSMKNKVLKEMSPNNSNMVLKEMSPNSSMKNKVLKEMSPDSSMKNKVLKEMSPNSSMKNKVLKEKSPNNSNMVLKEMSPNSSMKNKVLKEMSPNSSMKNKVLKEMSPNSSMKNKVLKEKSPNNSNMVLKEMSPNSSMNMKDLRKLTKNQLIELLLKKPTPPPRTGKWKNPKPIPAPRRSVKKMVEDYEQIVQQSPTPKPRKMTQSIEITQMRKALKKATKSFSVAIVDGKDPLNQLFKTKNAVGNHLMKELPMMKGFKYTETLKITFEKQLGDEMTIKDAYFNSRVKIMVNISEMNVALQKSRKEIMEAINQWISEGSGWTIGSVDGHYINLVKYNPLQGSSYIPLPSKLRNSAKGLINMKNNDNECFRWCHIRHLNPQNRNPQRIKKTDKEFINKLSYTDIEFPVTMKQINKIEKENSINVNVFGYEEEQPYPIYISDEEYEDHMELLLITEGENKHYVLIEDFNKFMYMKTKHKEKKHFCMHCLQCFSTEMVLNKHKENCIVINGKQAINMPEEGENILKYNNYHKQQAVPFIIYADFEAITEKVLGCTPKNTKSYTEAYQKHRDCGYGYKVVCHYDNKYSKPLQIYRGKNAVHKFMERMLDEVKYCKDTIKNEFNTRFRMTREDENNHREARECYVCNKQYTDKDVKVRSHCPVTGKYRGSAHSSCNMKLKLKQEEIKIPVVFHNLRGYDSHFIMQEIGAIVKEYTDGGKQMDINAIPNNMEKYMSFMLGDHLVFIDSFQFMSFSLDKLVSNLPTESFKYTSEEFKGEQFKLMTQKGVYPYDYMDSFEKFNETALPAKGHFYSIMNSQHISDKDYNHALNV